MRPLPLAGAVALALWLIVRRKRLPRWGLAVGAVAVAGLAAFGAGLVPVPDVERAARDAGRMLGEWTYLVVGLLAFLETGAFVGLVAPGETAVLIGGVIAGQGEIDPIVLIAVVWAAAVAGDLTSYALGRRLGRGFLERHGPRLRITAERLDQVEGFFERHGGPTILAGRFVGLVRALAPFIAGASRMPLRQFLAYDVLAAGAWSTVFVVLGYLFWRSLDRIETYVGRGTAALTAVLVLLAAAVFAYRLAHDRALRRRTRAWMHAQAERPALRPLAAVLRPLFHRVLVPLGQRVAGPARFVADRLTPGELGLELTTLLSVAAGGAFAFLLMATQVDDHSFLPGDTMAFDVVEPVRTGWIDDGITLLTDVGSFPAAALAVVATAVWAARHARVEEALALPLGMVLTLLATQASKAEIGRPRPAEPVAATAGLSYPSGHAAYAVAFVACAVVLVRAGHATALRFASVTVALAVAAGVGATRIYLRAHYLSDVLGGLALGLAVFATCGAVAVVVAHFRENPTA